MRFLLCSMARCGYFLSLLFLQYFYVIGSQKCALYDPPTPGINCLAHHQVKAVVTESKWLWVVEMYSSWCGHCQNFAPKLKELAEELDEWSHVVKMGVFECTGSRENQATCGDFGVQAYPTIRVT